MDEETVDIAVEDLWKHDESKNIGIYGPSGHGKTTMVAGAPNATFLSTEKGVIAARRTGSSAKVIRATDWPTCVAAVNYAEEKMGRDEWFIVDSGSKMQKLYLRWMMGRIHALNPARDLDIPAIQDHQKWQNGFTRWVDKIIDGPYNSIFVFNYMIREDDDGDDMYMPALVGKGYEISSYVTSQLDAIGYMAVSKIASTEEETIRRVLWQPYPPYIAKDRYRALGKWQDIHEGEFGVMGEFIEMIDDALAENANGQVRNQ
jgi:hypothetical protein